MKKKTRKTDIIIVIVIVLLIAAGIILSVIGNSGSKKTDDVHISVSYTDYNGRKIGILTGSSFEQPTLEYFPDSKYRYFDNISDLVMALSKGMIDGFVEDEPVLRMIKAEHSEIGYFHDFLNDADYSFAFQKNGKDGGKMREQFNEMLTELKTNGTLDDIRDKWFTDDPGNITIDRSGLTGENGKLNVGINTSNTPFGMVINGEPSGYAVELITMFCRKYGYSCTYDNVNISAGLAGITSGVYDVLASNITITPERQESVDFCLPIYSGGITLAVRSSELRESQKSYKDYNGKTIGVGSGSMFDAVVNEKMPDSPVKYYNTYPDMIAALRSGKIDGVCIDEPIIRYILNQYSDVEYLKEKLDTYNYGFAFAKNENGKALCIQFNDFIKQIKEDNTLDEIDTKWFSSDESKHTIPDLSTLEATNGVLTLAVEALNPPFVYVMNGNVVGYETDIAYRFCKEYGYGLEISDMSFDAIIPALKTGKCDFGCTCMNITPERAKSVYFSEPDYSGGAVLAVNASDLEQPDSITKDTPLSFFSEKKIGILTGSIYEGVADKLLPNAEKVYFDITSDMVLAAITGKIDGFFLSEVQADTLLPDNPQLFALNESAEVTPFAFAFPKTEKGAALRDEINGFLAKAEKDGTMNKLLEKWTKGDPGQTVDLTGFTGEKGVLKIACDPTLPPWIYKVGDKFAGYETELIAMFCREYGYKPQFDTMTFSAIIPGISSERYDMATANISVTPERSESVYFSNKESESKTVLITKASAAAVDPQNTKTENRPFSYYADNKKIGVITGALYEVMIKERYPNADLNQYNNQADLGAALNAGIIDCFTVPRSTAEDFKKQYSNFTYLNEVFTQIPYGFAFEKSQDKEYLRDQMNEFLKKIHDDGTYDRIVSVWFGDDESQKVVDYSGLTGENGSLKMVTTATMQPFSYIVEGKNAGLEIDLVTRFCREYGYSLEISSAEFASLIPGITSGMYDIAAGNIMVTKERAESVNFSDVYYTADAVAVVRDENGSAEPTPDFFSSIADSFEKNFIREDRWKIILDGIGTTCVITVLSTLSGTILAFLICMFRRTESKLANFISNIYVKLLQGTPMVVLLMILYYVIFGKSGLDAVWVAVIGFSLNFGAYGSEIMRSGIESIDGGQREAALALGYSENQAFFRFIFPQAAARFLPVYKQEIVSLLKSTSIVGYIAIQDLTKMSDIIRSRTYEAFFPLIATAVIYFILAWVISIIMKAIMNLVGRRKGK